MRRLLFTLLPILLTACADNIDKFMDNYQSLQGQKLDTVVSYIGMPDREDTIMGKKVYFWENRSYGSSITPVATSSTVNGNFGGQPFSGFGSSTTYQTDSWDLSCSLKAIVNARGIIDEAAYNGAPGACAKYGEALEKMNKVGLAEHTRTSGSR